MKDCLTMVQPEVVGKGTRSLKVASQAACAVAPAHVLSGRGDMDSIKRQLASIAIALSTPLLMPGQD
jgi:hypothetical protein